ncbi:hypothetical protein R5R35_011887 [Gryllus longicercus]|uniref:RUN domain-containing protein n=1 Tax=Gryllus longicercus TaxID=2509291 RepID=A0AAN9ZGJ5_9ORTH
MRLLRVKGPSGDAAASGPARLMALRGAAAAARASQSPATGTGASVVASGTGAMDDGGGGRAASPALLLGSSPGAAHAHAHALALALERDCNSNAAGSFASESASLPDADFVQECQDYQWFLDYGYREGGGPQPGAGLLASLASSSGLTAPAGYEDLARDIDANLAEVDMEDFRSEDIHSVLSTLPAMCCGDLQAACEPGGEMFASVSGSLLARLEMDASSAGSPPSCGSQADDSAGSTDTMSLCKSELLFSPVKDCPLPGSNFSVDSLDCDLLTEHDIMLTCQANKDNYTIAFEGSVTLYSEDSDYHEPDLDAGGAGAAAGGGAGGRASPAAWAASARALRLGAGRSRALDSSMARSDSVYTTWSKLQKRSSDAQLASRRAAAEGGGPRDAGGGGHAHAHAQAPPGGSPVAGALKSQSLPNLSRRRRRCLLASLSGRLRPAAAAAAMSSSAESDTRSPATTVKLYDVQQSSSGLSETNSSVDGGACSSCGSGSASGGGRRSRGGGGAPQQHFSLVKLFMKQKSQSSERVGYAMDQSSASECWPASANSASEGDSDSFAQEAAAAAAGGRAGGAAASPPLTPPQPQPPPPSPHRRRALSFNDNATAAAGDREANGNDGGARTDTDLDVATNNWIRADDLAPTPGAELSASCLEDSLAEAAARRRLDAPRPRARGRALRQQHLDEDEDEEEEEEEDDEDDDASERSESVEQLSESVSKIEESALDLGASSCGSSGPLSLSSAPPAPPPPSAACRPRLPSANNNSAPYAGACPARYAPPLAADNNNGSVEAAAAAADEDEEERRAQATQTAPALMNRSVQTSTTTASGPAPAPPPPPLKVLGPGAAPRVAKLLAAKKPLFVFYPNYALPDLTFLQDKRGRLDAAAAAAATATDAKVYLVPQTFRASPAPSPAPAATRGPAPGEKPTAPAAPTPAPAPALAAGARAGARRGAAGRRPFSCTDVEALRRKGFAHVQDWESLTVLLPRECRRILEEVPELEAHLKTAAQVDEKPHFCASPPPPPPATTVTAAHGTPKSRRPRPASCGDCPADTGGALEPKGVPTSSSSSSTATQPSSGYRGSSTMLLTDSSGGPPTTAPAYNPLFVYRYDSVSSEGSMMSTPAPPPKRSVSLPNGKKNPDKITSSPSPPRPPLPRGILRQPEKILAPAQTTITAYNCKVHKNQTNSKRYSMFELGACKGSSLLEDDEFAGLYDNDAKMRLGRLGPSRARAQTLGTASDAKEAARRLAACLHPEKDIDEAEDEEADEGVDADVSDDVSGGSIGEVLPPMPPMPHRNAPVAAVDELVDDEEEADEEGEGAALSLEELLQVSALSALGPAAAAAAAAATDGSTTGWDDTQMQRLRLQVSKFLLGQQPTEPGADCRTPHNTPEHHAAGCACGPAHKKSVSFAERAAASPLREDHEMSPSSGSIGSIGSPTDTELAHQRGLVMAVAGAVDALVRLFSTTHDPVVAAPAAAELALTKLCPALYAVLGDGLKARLDTPFGAIPNSVWQVVEASAQQGPMTQALSELVLRINGEDVLSEGALRFNAFAFALLNARSLDAWLAFVRTRERVLRRHYAPAAAGTGPGLLAAAAAGAPAARAALDRVVATLQPLALLPFRLDPLYEARRLHASLRRLRQLSPQGAAPSAAFCEDGPEAAGEAASPAPGANANTSAPGGAARQWTLRQLVRSIQSSLTASADEEAAAAAVSAPWLPPPPPPPRSPRRSPEALLRQALAGESAPHHPNCSGASVAPAEPLPDLLAAGGGGGRWAAGERPRARPRSCTNPSSAGPAAGAGAGFSLVTDLASTVRKRWSGIHLGSKLFQAFDRLAAEDSDEEYTDSLEPAPRASAGDTVPPAPPAPAPTPASAPSPSPASAPAPAQASSPAVTTGSTGGTAAAPSPAMGGGGKFRRLQMKWEMLSGKEGGSAPGSPSPKSPKSPAATTSPDGAGAGAGASGRSKIPRPVSSPVRPSAIPVAGAARRTASSGAAPAAASPAPAKRPTAAAATTARASRADRPAPGAAAARPSSLPYRAPSARPAARALPATRRAASSSQGRVRGDAHAHPTPRFVRTLCHRLPTDSGHLSFNEGERLRVVLEVDAEWLLCCRGDRKGLVPRSAVIGADAA